MKSEFFFFSLKFFEAPSAKVRKLAISQVHACADQPSIRENVFHFNQHCQKEVEEEERSKSEELFLRSEENMSQICQEFIKNDPDAYGEEEGFDKDSQEALYYGEVSDGVCIEVTNEPIKGLLHY